MFLGLIKNEFIKLFSKKKTYIILALFIALLGLMVKVGEEVEKSYKESQDPEYRIETIQDQIAYDKIEMEDAEDAEDEESYNQIASDLKILEMDLENAKLELKNGLKDDWRENVKNEITNLKKTMEGETDQEVNASLGQEITRLQVHLDEDINPEDIHKNTGFNYLLSSLTMIVAGFLGLGIIIFSADSVSNEYNPGTMKFLLIQPVSRVKVLLSKYIVMLISTIGLLAVTQGLFCIGVGIIKGFGSLNRPILFGVKYDFVVEKGLKVIQQIEGSGRYIKLSEYLLNAFFLEVLFIIVMTSFIFMISTIARSSVVAITISIAAFMGTNIIFSASTTYKKFSHLVFIHFSNIDGILSGHIVGQTGSLQFTYLTVVIVSIISTLLFTSIALITFKKRDVLI
jgi:ABC-2 type transport system permease protein